MIQEIFPHIFDNTFRVSEVSAEDYIICVRQMNCSMLPGADEERFHMKNYWSAWEVQ